MGRIEYKLYVWEEKIKELSEKGGRFWMCEWVSDSHHYCDHWCNKKIETEERNCSLLLFLFQDSLNSQLSVFVSTLSWQTTTVMCFGRVWLSECEWKTVVVHNFNPVNLGLRKWTDTITFLSFKEIFNHGILVIVNEFTAFPKYTYLNFNLFHETYCCNFIWYQNQDDDLKCV